MHTAAATPVAAVSLGSALAAARGGSAFNPPRGGWVHGPRAGRGRRVDGLHSFGSSDRCPRSRWGAASSAASGSAGERLALLFLDAAADVERRRALLGDPAREPEH